MTLRFQGSSRTRALAAGLLAAAATACSADSADSPTQTAGSGGLPAGGGGSGGATSGAATGGASGGTAGTVATAGSGGASGGSGGATTAGSGGAAAGSGGAAAGSGGAGGSSTYVACPADATFCSGFEDTALPDKAVYKYNAAPGEWTRDFEVDTTIFRHGKSALKVKGAGGSGAYQMLAVPTPTTGPFWARFYLRQDEMDIGGLKHNVYAGASDSDDPNPGVLIEVAEDVGLAFNTADNVRRPEGYGYIGDQKIAYTLAKSTWHCVQVQFDGQARVQKLYVANVEVINATDYPAAPAMLKFFKFGMNAPNGPQRAVWYDDVAVGPTKPDCAP